LRIGGSGFRWSSTYAGQDRGERLAEEIRAASGLEMLVAAMQGLPAVVGSLLDAAVDPIDVGHVIGQKIDELTIRLIELHASEGGELATTFSWLALGSAARHEQAMHTDQDQAIAFDGDEESAPSFALYLAGLGEAVTSGLEACGIARCEGNVMAANPALRRTVPGWRERFGVYVSDPGIMGSHLTGIMFDYRRVTGTLEVEVVLDEVIREAHRDPAFMKRLATSVVEVRPPTGRRHGIDVKHGEHPGKLDIKRGAITPITNLARFYAIDAGLTQNRTMARLRGAAAAGRISEQLRDDLEEAFRIAWRIRLEHHVLQAEAGEPLDDFVVPESLRPIPLRSLGEALRLVDEAQSVLAGEWALR
jgi:CBS domain-containing protein